MLSCRARATEAVGIIARAVGLPIAHDHLMRCLVVALEVRGACQSILAEANGLRLAEIYQQWTIVLVWLALPLLFAFKGLKLRRFCQLFVFLEDWQ